MTDIAIRVENLSKQCRIGGPQARYKTIRESLIEAAQAPFRRLVQSAKGMAQRAKGRAHSAHNPMPYAPCAMPSANYIWALKDVSFKVKQGEVVGIIGRNGAGKTTLLKILSRITEPTEGTQAQSAKGRVLSAQNPDPLRFAPCALRLKVGTGFHSELTGRENIYLNGAILGMKKVEIERKFDEIVAFAEVEKFIDTPVKHYSSGMYMRLAFSVATHPSTGGSASSPCSSWQCLESKNLLVDAVPGGRRCGTQKRPINVRGEMKLWKR